MPLDPHLRRRVRQALAAHGPASAPALHDTRLLADARRLWRRLQTLLQMDLVHNPPNLHALELACYALQLPLRPGEDLPVGQLGVTPLRDRSERAALRLVEELGEDLDPPLLDDTARLLMETPHRPPVLEEAKLLADAVNLDDFGAIGLLRQAIALGLRGQGVDALGEGWERRTVYGYWEARLNDGFHFPAVQAMARKRFESARRIVEMLEEERREDGM